MKADVRNKMKMTGQRTRSLCVCLFIALTQVGSGQATGEATPPDYLTYGIPRTAKRILAGKWRPWGVDGVYYSYDYLVDGEKVGTRRYYQADGLFQKKELRDQQTFWHGALHGLVIETSVDRMEGYFRLGKREGITRKWMADGRLDEEAEYRNGERHGPTKRPIQKMVSEYRNGKKDGIEIWETHGYMGYSSQVTVESKYVCGVKQGLSKIFEGHVAEHPPARSNLLACIEYGVDQINGNFEQYEDGWLRWVTRYAKGKRLLGQKFNDAGDLIGLTTYDGMDYGVVIRWRDDGSPSSANFHLHGRLVTEADYRKAAKESPVLPQIGTSMERESFLAAFQWKMLSEQGAAPLPRAPRSGRSEGAR